MNCSLESLDLSINGFAAEKAGPLDRKRQRFCLDGPASLAPVLQQLPRLRRLEIGGNELADDGAQKLLTSLARSQSVTALSLSCTVLRDTELLAAGLKVYAALESLDLHGNPALCKFEPLVA